MSEPIKNKLYLGSLSRRDFLLITIGIAAGFFIGKEIPQLAQKPSKVAVVKVPSYTVNVKDLLKPYFKQFDLNLKGKQVLLKPNLVDYNEKFDQIITNPDVLLAAIELFSDIGARVIVGEASGLRRDTNTLLYYSQYKEVLSKYNVKFVDLNMDEIVKLKIGGNLTGLDYFYIPKTVIDSDFIVSMPKLKTHHWMGVTISLKNMFGVMPGLKYGWPKNKLHYVGVERSILDINYTIRPDFTIIDGVWGIEGNGPLFGTPKHLGAVIMSNDLVAADTISAKLMGINPEKVTYLKLATLPIDSKTAALGNMKNIEVIGESINNLKQDFILLDEFKDLRL